MLDLTILRILKYKEAYDRVVPSLPREALDPKTRVLLDDFGKFFAETGHPVIKMGAFKTVFFNFYHRSLSEEQADYYSTLLDRAEKDADPETTRLINNQLVELSFATDVGNMAADYDAGKEIDIIHEVGGRHERAKESLLRGDVSSLIEPDDIDSLLDEDESHSGLQWRLTVLRESLRPLRAGDLVIAAGRPDTGKTTFVLSEASHMAPQLPIDRPIAWFNNEGPGNRIVKRSYQAVLGCTVDDLLARRDAGTLRDEYLDALAGRAINVVNCHSWTQHMVEDAIDQMNPGLVIFDMIDNINFVGQRKDARTDQVLESMYQWARELGVKHDFPVIACSQVSAEAELQPHTQCYPAQHMLKDSKTGKQGAADLIIMVGRSADPMMANKRFISTPKNKLALPSKPVDNYKEVNFNGAIARYSDLVRAATAA